jgi:hypothetical protein
MAILDAAELSMPGLPDKARFKEEAVPGKSGLFVLPEVVHLAPDELAVLTGAGMKAELDPCFRLTHAAPSFPSENRTDNIKNAVDLIVGI